MSTVHGPGPGVEPKPLQLEHSTVIISPLGHQATHISKAYMDDRYQGRQ